MKVFGFMAGTFILVTIGLLLGVYASDAETYGVPIFTATTVILIVAALIEFAYEKGRNSR